MPVDITYLMAQLAAECLALGNSIVSVAYAAGVRASEIGAPDQ